MQPEVSDNLATLTDAPMPPGDVAPPTTAAPPALEHEPVETILTASRGWIGINWSELFQGRELLYFLVWRDIKVRYKQAMLGVGWVVLQPLFNMVLFTVVFGSAAGFKGRLGPEWGPKYAVFVFVALLPWQVFATGLNSGGMSLLSQQNLLTKIYFPRLFVPTSVVGGALLDMAISFVFVAGLIVWFHVKPSIGMIFLPLLLAQTLACTLGVAYLFSALTVTYRDFRFLIPFIGQVWLFASFVAFPPSVFGTLGPRMKFALALNPMYGNIAAWRKVLLGGAPDSMTGWDPALFASSLVITAGVLLLGLFYFRRTEKRFADIA